MTLRTLVLAAFATAAGLPPSAYAGTPSTAVVITAPQTVIAGAVTPISCSATDPDGIARLVIKATAPDSTSTVLGVAFGVESTSVDWVPAQPGGYVLGCQAKGASSAGAVVTNSAFVIVDRAPAPVVSIAEPAPAAPSAALAPADIGASVYQDGLGARMIGPRKVAATAEGELFVVDVQERLHRLTRRGELVGTTLEGVTAVAAGSGVVFAAMRDATLLQVDARTGRTLGRFELRSSDLASGLAYDEARSTLWIAFSSGVLQARRPDGQVVHELDTAGTRRLVRLVDVAVDPAGVIWVAQDRAGDGGFIHAFDAVTGAYLQSVGSSAAGQVQIAGGLAFVAGRLYVSDLFSGHVQIVDPPSGAVLDVIGKYGAEAGSLRSPAGLAFMTNGDLLVANMDTNRLDRFGSGAALPICLGDQDCDGLSDFWELAYGMDPADPRNALTDVDGDGLNETEEYAARTDPRRADTDGDGYGDSAEVLAGYDPVDPEDHLPVLALDVPFEVEPGLVQLHGTVNDRGRLGDCGVSWRQVAGPVISLEGASTLDPAFIARRGVFGFEAVATCAGQAGRAALIAVTVRNVPPQADGGRVVTVAAGKRANLVGAFSSDANGDKMSFVWDQLLGAPVVGTTPGQQLGTQLSIPGYYLFRLGVTDPSGAEGAAEVPVVVVGDTGAPTALASTPILARTGDRAVLDASGSFRSPSATFYWEQIAGPWAELENPESEAPAFVVPGPGRYAFQVSVIEDGASSPPATVEVYAADVNAELPVARIDAPPIAAVNRPITLDGGQSAASGGAALGYSWRQVSGPAAGLTRADRAAAIVVPFAPGAYEFELLVDDGVAVSLPARVRMEARADGLPIPRAVASAPGMATVGQVVPLDGTASTGAAGYRWTQVEGPWVAVEQGRVGAFRPLVPGVYGFELQVDDGKVRSAPSRVSVMVFQNGMEN
jgi:sugar lactone lactonase YvrE